MKFAFAGTAALLFCVPATAETYWARGVSANGGWHDAAKTWSGDSQMCWAASASNILWWWQDKFVIPSGVPAGDDIWNTVRNSFSDTTGTQDSVYKMWFDGNGTKGGFYKNRTGFKLGAPDYKVTDISVQGFSAYAYGITAQRLSDMVKTKFENGWGLSIGVTEKTANNYQHAITVWGAELTNGILSKIWITDSDDFYNGLVACDIEVKENNFYLTPSYYSGKDNSFFSAGNSYYIHKYVWLDSNADFLPQIPEPSAFGLLAGTAALALAGMRRRKRNTTRQP